MASIKGNEKMERNASILQQKVFSLDLFKLLKFGMAKYNQKIHPEYYLILVLRFSDLMLMMLEEYSKGRILTIQTHRKKRVRVRREEYEKEDEMVHDAIDLLSDEEDEVEERNVEKKFSFGVEMAELVDYNIIFNINQLLIKAEELDNETVSAIAHLYNRLLKQCNAGFVFFQIDTLYNFEQYALKYRKDTRLSELTHVIKKITGEFFKACQKNKMLPMECLFRFTDKAQKDHILSNYSTDIIENYERGEEMEDDEISDEEGRNRQWTEDED